jgi:hypothetical protein
MARYIDAERPCEYYKALANIEWNKNVAPVSWADAYNEFVDYLEELPTADVVEVVRCKDCKYGEVSIHSITNDGQKEVACYCNLRNAVTDVDGYCPKGKRSDTE